MAKNKKVTISAEQVSNAIVDWTLNPRKDRFDIEGSENYEAYQVLKNSIKQAGFKPENYGTYPIVYIEDEQVHVVSGFNRFKILQELIAEGEPIKRIDVLRVDKQLSETEMIFTHYRSNSGQKNSPIDIGFMVETLVTKYNYKLKEVAEEFGKASSQLSQYRKKWNALSETTQKAYKDGEITAKQANTLSEVDEKTQEVTVKTVKQVKEAGGKVTDKDVKEFLEDEKKPKVKKVSFAQFVLSILDTPTEYAEGQEMPEGGEHVKALSEFLYGAYDQYESRFDNAVKEEKKVPNRETIVQSAFNQLCQMFVPEQEETETVELPS